MELDARVKALEYEMKILKNEIQRTLLDIQEQVLVHYYPTLRAEDTAPPAEAVAQLANRAAAAATASAPAPILKKVSLDEVRPTTPPPAAPKASGSVDQAAMVKLLEWVNDSIARLGSQRTSRLIGTCVTRAILDNDTKAILLRLTSLNQQADPAQVATNDVLTIVLRLDEELGRAADIDEALTIIEEAGLG
ncbi:MAG: hypothetical protein HY870_10910 [Chloroflexi bacterium]|nr:hypothetical protein [Chloroflexota bacterium]